MAFSHIGLYRASIAAIVSSIAFAGTVDAAKRAIPIRQRLVEAVSITRLCPKLHVDRAVFERLARQQGMRTAPGSRDMRIFERQVKAQVPHLLQFRRGVVCGLGRADFGPDGLIIKGLLRVQ
jgi:hypothetical protein